MKDTAAGLISGGKKLSLRIPKKSVLIASTAIERALKAFQEMEAVSEERIGRFFQEFGQKLANDRVWRQIVIENDKDIAAAGSKKLAVGRLQLNERVRQAMIDGLKYWQEAESLRGKVRRVVDHKSWTVEEVYSGLGVVAFVFEGRPNVFADAVGVIKGGNTCVLRIGSDALKTAKAIMNLAFQPALKAARLPEGTVELIDSAEHSISWALFSDARVSLGVVRGSGAATRLLGALGRQSGIPMSLHGAGGAWMIVASDADPKRLKNVVYHSLDRKVCNTLNTICVPENRAYELITPILKAMSQRAAEFGAGYKIHFTKRTRKFLPKEIFEKKSAAAVISEEELGQEWEWDKTPEVSIAVVDAVDEAIELFNKHSARFMAAVISNDEEVKRRAFQRLNTPFFGDGFTRWVDGQFIFGMPELGLSNFEEGRILGRGGVLSGGDIYTIRLRMRQKNDDLHR